MFVCVTKHLLLKLQEWQNIQLSATTICSTIYENTWLYVSAMSNPSTHCTAN